MTNQTVEAKRTGRPSNLSKEGALRDLLVKIQNGERPSARYIKQLEEMGMITREKGAPTGTAGRPAFVINLTDAAKELVA